MTDVVMDTSHFEFVTPHGLGSPLACCCMSQFEFVTEYPQKLLGREVLVSDGVCYFGPRDAVAGLVVQISDGVCY